MISSGKLTSTILLLTILSTSFSISTTALPQGSKCFVDPGASTSTGSISDGTTTPGSSTSATQTQKPTTSPTLPANIDIDGNNLLNQGLPADIFHNLGPYSTRYTNVQQTTDDIAVPSGCKIAIANTLERHGARRMTASALKRSSTSLTKLQAALKSINSANLTLLNPALVNLTNIKVATETDLLIPYGAMQAYLSGVSKRSLYPHFTNLFTRSSGAPRVILTSQFFLQGFQNLPFPSGPFPNSSSLTNIQSTLPVPEVIISEDNGFNNTLDVSSCTDYENLPSGSKPVDIATGQYLNSTIAVTILPKLVNALKLAGGDSGLITKLAAADVINIMDFCAFETLGRGSVVDGVFGLDTVTGVSAFCLAFDLDDWKLYEYYYDVSKFYTSGYGNDKYYKALGHGYLRELISRLTEQPVNLIPPGSLNTTLDANGASTFPLGSPKIFADFSHDNNIVPILSSLGLFNDPNPLSTSANTSSIPHKFITSQLVPFGGNVLFERIDCSGNDNQSAQHVRIVVNGIVQDVDENWCPGMNGLVAIGKGICPLTKFLEGLKWVDGTGVWDVCNAAV
ncbi:hypothetical protein HDU76_007962 [Blyttiomyces sp. JEL0837]|nr:hypothetical protein HDU76_007962 [Blyttiomyces sp. JEL0837]